MTISHSWTGNQSFISMLNLLYFGQSLNVSLLRIIFLIKEILTRACRNRFVNRLCLALPLAIYHQVRIFFFPNILLYSPNAPVTPPPKRSNTLSKISVLCTWFCIANLYHNLNNAFQRSPFFPRALFSLWTRKQPFRRHVSGSKNDYFTNR